MTHSLFFSISVFSYWKFNAVIKCSRVYQINNAKILEWFSRKTRSLWWNHLNSLWANFHHSIPVDRMKFDAFTGMHLHLFNEQYWRLFDWQNEVHRIVRSLLTEFKIDWFEICLHLPLSLSGLLLTTTIRNFFWMLCFQVNLQDDSE